MDRYIMISGMKRTGSTWQANAVRLLCEEAYGEDHVWIGEEYEAKAQRLITINKVHPYIRRLAGRADYVLTSFRPLEGVKNSWKRFEGEEVGQDKLQSWVTWLIHWNLHADHMTNFQMLNRRKSRLQEFLRIANVIDLAHTLDSIEKERAFRNLENLEPPEEGHDERTLMFDNHKTSERFK